MGRGRASPSWTWCQQVSRTLSISLLRLGKALGPSCIPSVMVGCRGTHSPSCSGCRWLCPWQSQSSGHQGRVGWQLPGTSWLEWKTQEKAKLVEGFYSLLPSREMRFMPGVWKHRSFQSMWASETRSKSGSKLPWGHSPSPP